MKQITNGSSTGLLLTPETGVSSSRSWLLFSAVAMLLLQLFAGKASATTITGGVLTCTQTMTATTSCVTGDFASSWTGAGTHYWLYTISTVGYDAVQFSTGTSSSGTGPTSGQVWVDYGSGFVQITSANYSVNTSCGSTGVVDLAAFNSACNNNASLKVKLIMSGATNAGGTNRVATNAFTGHSFTVCSVTPTPGTISGGITEYCGSGSETLTLGGATSGSDITYQWQDSVASGSWTNVGTNSLTYATGTITATTYYRVKVTCTSASLVAYSPVFTITVDPLPSTPSISSVPGLPVLVSDSFVLAASPAGGTWGSSNTSVGTVDVISGKVKVQFGGTTFITYTVTNGFGCQSSAIQQIDALWDNTLGLYAGYNGTSTAVIIPADSVSTSALTATGFGSSTACGTGGLSGLTVNTSVTAYSPAGPHVSFKLKPDPRPGVALNVFELGARVRVSATGPTKARLAYSLDGGTNWIADSAVNLTDGSCGTSANVWFWTTGGPTITGLKDSILVGLFPYASSSNTGAFQVNLLEASGRTSNDLNCGGTLTGGTVRALSTTSICDSGFRTMELVHLGGVGISYQWQDSNSSHTWADVAGAVNVFLTSPVLHQTTKYRVKVKCSIGPDSTYSNVMIMTVTPTPAHDIITGPGTALFGANTIYVGGSYNFGTHTTIIDPVDTSFWVSNYTSTANIDPATGNVASTVFPGIVTVTFVHTLGGCTVTTKDTFKVLYQDAIAYYLGQNGTSTTVSPVQNAAVTALEKTGFTTGTSCGTGGLSGMTNAPASFSTSNAHVSFKIAQPADSLMVISGIRATVRSSATGPASLRFAYRLYNSGWGAWIDEGGDQVVNVDDCGYSPVENFWGDASVNATPVSFPFLLTGIADSVELAVYPFNPSNSTGSFEINSFTVAGQVKPLCGASTDVLNDTGGLVDNSFLCLGTHALHLNVSADQTYWGNWVPNDPTLAYFDFTSMSGSGTGTIRVLNSYTDAVIFSIGYKASLGCLQLNTATVDYDNTCGSLKHGTAGVANSEKTSDISFYPNPAGALLNVNAAENVDISISAIDGKLLIDQKNAKHINISGLANGMYIIKAYDDKHMLIKTDKFIKQ